MSLANLAPGGAPAAWRWLIERVWRLEHAFERSRAAARPEDDTRIRIFFVMAIFGLAFTVLALGATWAAVFSKVGGNGYLASTDGARGDLVDRNGQLLAVDLTHYALYINPKDVWDAKATRKALAKALPQVPAKRLDQVVFADRRGFLVGGMTPAEKDAIFDLGLPGVEFEEQAARVYPLGASAAHFIGFVDKGGKGLSGAEKALDKPVREAAAKGPDGAIPLSIDLRVQAALEDEVRKAAIEFQAKDAVGIVTNVHTGEILGLVSYPDYDPNQLSQASAEQMTNHAAASVYEMGSTFKAFTLAMALDTGKYDLNSMWDARGPLHYGKFAIHDDEPKGRFLNMKEVFTFSSNVGAARIALSQGVEGHKAFLRKMGQLDRLRTELPESASPIVPKRWGELNTVTISFGHGIAVAPLQAVMGINALVNGGYLIPPTFMKRSESEAAAIAKRVIKTETSDKMRFLMRLNAEIGTAKTADIKGYYVGGKTGTSEKVINGRYAKKRVLNSFTAIMPCDDPKYQILIMLDEPQAIPETKGFITSGWNAVPTGGKVIERIAPLLGVEPRFDLPPAERLILAASRTTQ